MIPDPLVIERLEQRTGMTLASLGGERTVGAAMQRCLERSGFTHLHAWRDAVLHSPDQWNLFVHEVIVPETFFFRYPESFDALAEWAKMQSNRHLRILSLPCSTGEEPYSIAITLREAGLPANQFEILAGDIDHPSIERARTGEYQRASSFRAELAERSRNYWEDHPGGGVCLTDSIRKTVTFRPLNLWELPVDGEKWDVIFCRNLLIYFSEEKQIAALEKMATLLQPDGLLFLGPAEVPVAGKHGWRSIDYPMAFACQRATPSTPAPLPVRRPAPASRVRVELPRPVPPPPVVIPPPTPEITVAQIREMADRGETTRAETTLENHLKRFPHEAEAQSLAGLLAEASGQTERAESFFRKAIYLDPEHGEAIAHLAILLESQGRLAAARKLRERAERLPAR